MSAKDVKTDRKYTKEHEWAWLADGKLRVGITAFAVDQLGDVTLVNFDVKVGDRLVAGKPFGTIESVKTLSDLFAPVNGKIVEVNQNLESSPELVNEDCYGKGWMIVVECDSIADVDALLSPETYVQHVEESAH
jgi:glycine cleavage system H protein